MSRVWTPEDEARLEALHAAGLRDRGLAAALDRSVAAVRQRRQELGVVRPRRPVWSRERDARLRRLDADGADLAAAAQALGVSVTAVAVRRSRLGLSSRRPA
ncbi:hypothetical protein [Antarcticirhabdus aurantiaca]|uniref:hypothetical protein n=1 Tax=Antarcticirhabdus aurantiaca TaxID=2606717 RepID=UPI00131D07C5|nr:hypothetical protein [Antarcticirhabdus aurantiaca]